MHLSRFLLAGIAGCLLTPAFAADNAPAPVTVPANVSLGGAVDPDAELLLQASYVIGTEIAQKISGIIEQMDLNQDQLMKGLGDVLANKPPAIPPAEMGAIMQRFQEKQQRAEADKAAKEAAEAPKRKEKNVAWLAENAKRPGIKTTASGLQYEVLAAGTGGTPKMGDQVSVNYKGSLLDGSVFDASERRGGPASFTLGEVIAGWNEALALMKEGDKWKVYIPSELAYGEQGPPSIGLNQVLIFELELLKVSPKS